MRAIRLLRHGAPLAEEDIADPEPAWGEVFIEIRAAGICYEPAEKVDVALDFVGDARLCLEGPRVLAPGGRLILVALNLRSLQLDPYADVLTRERQILGCSDHTRKELLELMRMKLDVSRAISRCFPLQADIINEILNDLERGTTRLHTVIVN